jgi:porin
MPFQVNGGAVYTGLIPGRKTDATLLGIAYGNFSPNFAAQQSE